MNDMEKIVRLNAFIQHTRLGKLYLDGREVMCVSLARGCTFEGGKEDELILTDEQLEELFGQTYGKPPAVSPLPDENGIAVGDSVLLDIYGQVESITESQYMVRFLGELIPVAKAFVKREEVERG